MRLIWNVWSDFHSNSILSFLVRDWENERPLKIIITKYHIAFYFKLMVAVFQSIQSMLFYFKGLEDKEQNLTRRISASDILSEKVRSSFLELGVSVRLILILLCSVLLKEDSVLFSILFLYIISFIITSIWT